jgi:small subunit ribosomal protein S16
MPVKIRLQRHGKKGKPFYWIVAADSRAKRDGRYLKKLGTYNPNINPALITLNFEDTLKWLEKGAQPTDTARTLLSYKGVMIKHHLNGGVRKGALTQEEADKKFKVWLEEKEIKIQAKKDGLSKDESEARVKRLANEKAVSEKRLADAAVAEAEAAAKESASEAKEEETSAVEELNDEIGTPEAEQTVTIEKKASREEVEEIQTDKASNKEAVNPQEEETKAAEEKKSAPKESPASEEVKDDDATSEAKPSSEQTEE